MTDPCATCDRLRPDSPSPFFCSDECQRQWYARRALPPMPDRTAAVPRQLAHLRHWRSGPRGPVR